MPPSTTLPRHCSVPVRALDRVVFQGACTSIGAFVCPVGHPSFHDTGPIARHVVVFPRTSVWITHDRSRAFVADPTVATIYNRAQRYTRAPISPEGDRCDWFAVNDETAREIAVTFDESAMDRERDIFAAEAAPCDSALYLRQRALVHQAARTDADPMALEEGVLDIVASVLRRATGARSRPLARGAAAAARRVDLVEAAKAELLLTLGENRSPGDIAESVGTSVYHLCRIFRAQTGRTMHAHRTALRLRVAIERMVDGDRNATLSTIAHDLGFASHPHFASLCRRMLGASPSVVRQMMRET